MFKVHMLSLHQDDCFLDSVQSSTCCFCCFHSDGPGRQPRNPTGRAAVILTLILLCLPCPSGSKGTLDSRIITLECVCLLTISPSCGMYLDVPLVFSLNVNHRASMWRNGDWNQGSWFPVFSYIVSMSWKTSPWWWG